MLEVLTFVELDIELDGDLETFRFTYPQEDALFDSIPALNSLSITPATVDPGKSIGVRAKVSVGIKDFPYPLQGTSFDSGTFFGKLRARKRSLQGSALRVIFGTTAEDISDMVTEHYVIESLMRTSGDIITVSAKDLLKLADGDRAQAPPVSSGRINAAMGIGDTSLTLTPESSFGDYPNGGYAAIGGSEIVSFVRSGGSMLVVRGQLNTEAKEHEADEVVQWVLIYDSEDPSDIVYDLLTSYTSINPLWLPYDDWIADTSVYIGRLYSAQIAIPTDVDTLLNELIEQVGLVMWWDPVNQRVRLKSLRPVTGARTIGADEMLADTFEFHEQPDKRASQVWTYFALRNPLAKLDDTSNYRSQLITVDTEAEAEYGQPAVRKIFSRWIEINNRPAASRLNSLLLSRYRDPPRKMSFDLFRTSAETSLGEGLQIGHWSLQDANGDEELAPVQIISLAKHEDRYEITTEEMLFTSTEDPDVPEGVRLVIIDTSTFNENLRDLHDSFYTAAVSGDEIQCVIEADVIIGSSDPSLPSFDVGSWPSGVVITIVCHGILAGAGGRGGSGDVSGSGLGEQGGTALYTRHPINFSGADGAGTILGGGGGGGGVPSFQNVGGGGGAGTVPGSGGVGASPGTAGTDTEGGIGGSAAAGSVLGGAGGGPGLPGGVGTGSAGGAAGNAVDGDSFVTYVSGVTITGPRVN